MEDLMKIACTILMITILVCPAFARPVPLNTAETAANWAVESVWGPLNILERETLYYPDGEISTYCFTYGQEGVDFINEDNIRAGYNLRQAGMIEWGWDFARGAESYAYAVISADDERGPVMEMCDGLPAHLIFKWDVLRDGGAILGTPVSIVENYYLFPLDNWFEVSNGLESVFINPRYQMELTPQEFAELETMRELTGNPTAADYWELVTTSPVPVPEDEGYISGVPNFDQEDTDCGPHASAQAVGYWDDHTYMGQGPWDLLIDVDFWGLRDEMRQAMGWVPGGGVTVYQIRDGIVTVCNDPVYNNNYSFDASLYNFPDYTVCSNAVEGGRPGVIAVFEHSIYGNHAMTLVGYNDTPTQMVQVHDNWPPSNNEPWLEWNETFDGYVDVYPAGGAPTPITLLGFSGMYGGTGITLSWATASEIDCYGYNLLRDGENGWQQINETVIPAQGSSASTTTYTFLDADVIPGNIYTYQLQTCFIDGRTEISASTVVKTLCYELAQNTPNPFNPATNIRYIVPEAGAVTLYVYDVKGSLVEKLVEGYQEADIYNISFNGGKYSSGIYFYRLQVGEYTALRKMVLLK